MQAFNDVSKDYRAIILRANQCQNFDFVYISIRVPVFQSTGIMRKEVCENMK
jgi:hypothetical protein